MAMRPAPLLSATLLLAALLVSGCATPRDGRFPSLARRDVERAFGTIQPPPPPPMPERIPPSTGSRLAIHREQALEAHRRFEQRRGRAASLVAAARGAAIGSESWSVAQVALADLEAARSESMIALADLDVLYTGAAEAAAPTGGSAELDAVAAVRDEVSGWIGQEDAVLAELRGRLAS